MNTDRIKLIMRTSVVGIVDLRETVSSILGEPAEIEPRIGSNYEKQ